MPNICLYLHAHQPIRLAKYSVFDIGSGKSYFDDEQNRFYINRIAQKSYRPLNTLLSRLIERYGKDFKVSFSITGALLEQFELFAPDVLEDFQDLVATGNVELISETYYHSLASQFSPTEFREQTLLQENVFQNLFNQSPKTFRNTELAYNNRIAELVDSSKYTCILTEGVDRILGWRSPNFVYSTRGKNKKHLLLKNYKLSDDIAFRFSQKSWSGWPLTADKFTQWVDEIEGDGVTINLFMDYETFGEHQWESTGIFDFLRSLPGEILNHPDNNFKTPMQVLD